MEFVKNFSDCLSQIESYLGVKAESLLVFSGGILAAAVVATGIYWGVFGFGHWKNEMNVASTLMTAAATAPVQAMQAGQSGQYVCPTHGAVGLPRANAAGQAVCPICAQPMQLRCFGAAPSATPAAFQPGGGGGGGG